MQIERMMIICKCILIYLERKGKKRITRDLVTYIVFQIIQIYEIYLSMWIEKEFLQIFYCLNKILIWKENIMRNECTILSKKDVSILIGFYILDTNT